MQCVPSRKHGTMSVPPPGEEGGMLVLINPWEVGGHCEVVHVPEIESQGEEPDLSHDVLVLACLFPSSARSSICMCPRHRL